MGLEASDSTSFILKNWVLVNNTFIFCQETIELNNIYGAI